MKNVRTNQLKWTIILRQEKHINGKIATSEILNLDNKIVVTVTNDDLAE